MLLKVSLTQGEIGSQEFCKIMLKEIQLYTQSRLSDDAFTDFKTQKDTEFSNVGAMKMILMEQLRTGRIVQQLAGRLQVPGSPSCARGQLATHIYPRTIGYSYTHTHVFMISVCIHVCTYVHERPVHVVGN